MPRSALARGVVRLLFLLLHGAASAPGPAPAPARHRAPDVSADARVAATQVLCIKAVGPGEWREEDEADGGEGGASEDERAEGDEGEAGPAERGGGAGAASAAPGASDATVSVVVDGAEAQDSHGQQAPLQVIDRLCRVIPSRRN